ncbi:MAG TPA: ABC transporter permease [Firmicutes bacterium]|nr:ABC transporter permease [Bacillota bacterium]
MTVYLFKLAVKNLLRHKRRTFLTFLAISAGLSVFIIEDSLIAGFDREAIQNLINLESGHLRIHIKNEDNDFFPDSSPPSLDKAFPPEEASSIARTTPGMIGVAPRVRFSAFLNNGWEEYPVTGIGIHPELDGEVFTIAAYLTAGRLPEAAKSEAVLGAALAALMGLEVGDYFTLVTKTAEQSFQALDLEVTGLLDSPHPEVNKATVFLPLDVAQEALLLGTKVTEIAVRLPPGAPIKGGLARLQGELTRRGAPAELKVSSWEELSREFLELGDIDQKFAIVFMGLVMLIAVVGVVNSILLGAMERTREIGIMKAMGLSEREIVQEFLFEGLLLGLLGGLAGVAVSLLAELYLVNWGLDITPFVGDLDFGYPVAAKAYAVWNPRTALIALLISIVAGAAAAYIPARRAARLDPAVALRHG